MKLSQLLRENLVVQPLDATDKWSAIQRLAQCAADAGALPVVALPAVQDALLARERSMTTGMESGIAIPHAAVDGLEDVVAVLGIARSGIPFESLDGQPARIVVCLVIPRSKKLLHIRTLAEIARLLSRRDVRDAMLAAKDAAELLAVVRDKERESV